VAELEVHPMPEHLQVMLGAVNTCKQCQDAPATLVVVQAMPERVLSFWCQTCVDREKRRGSKPAGV
jgi:hypothetical protein